MQPSTTRKTYYKHVLRCKPESLPGEEWHTTLEFDYQVSNLGRVENNRGWVLQAETLKLCRQSVQMRMSVHRLVMQTFVGHSELDVRHMDGNPSNNYLSNLAYGTKSQNEQDKRLVGTYQEGARNPFARLTQDQVDWVKDITAHDLVAQRIKGKTRRSCNILVSIAKELGVSRSCVKKIAEGKSWARQ